MATYVVLLNWTDEGIRSFKESPRRARAAAEVAEKLGGNLREVYWTLGAYDLACIVDAPDDETVMATMLALSSQGNIRSTTLRAFDEAAFQQIVDKAP